MDSATHPSAGAPPFAIKDAPLDGHRPMKVRVIGAGFCGIYLGVRIPQRLRNVDLRIYERHAGVGGTWWVNRYPGVCVFYYLCEMRGSLHHFSMVTVAVMRLRACKYRSGCEPARLTRNPIAARRQRQDAPATSPHTRTNTRSTRTRTGPPSTRRSRRSATTSSPRPRSLAPCGS